MFTRCTFAGMTLISALAALAACSSLPPSPSDLVDENTGSTLTVVAAPLQFAGTHYEAAASVNDWATLVAVERDTAGQYAQFLLLYRWSTFEAGMSPPPMHSAGRLLIQADGRVIELQPLERVPPDLSRREQLFVPNNAHFFAYAYSIDFDTMRLIAASRELNVRLPQEPYGTTFSLSQDGRPALTQFVKRATRD